MEESEVRNHLVVGEGPYLTLAEDQYCVSGESRFLPVNLPISLCKSVHIALLFFSLNLLAPNIHFFTPQGIDRQTQTHRPYGLTCLSATSCEL